MQKTRIAIVVFVILIGIAILWQEIGGEGIHILSEEEKDQEKQTKVEKKKENLEDEAKETEKAKETDEDREEKEEEKDEKEKEKEKEKEAEQETVVEEEPTEKESTAEPKYEQEELIQKLEDFQSPIEGATITRRESQLPGAPREYRNGIHEGVDYYNGFVDVPIEMGTEVLAVDEGVIKRADHGYEEMTPERHQEILNEARGADITPEWILDKLRGKQVWIEHEGGIVTRYAHLYSIPENIEEGKEVEAGEHIGGVGNSGTSDGVEGTNGGAHLHFEIWISDDYYLGKDMEPMESREILMEVLN